MSITGQKALEFAGFRLDRARRVLTGPDGKPIELKPKVFDTLAALAERPGQLVDKATLMDVVWRDVVVEENNLNQAISALRKALGDDADRRLIVTVPGRGYQFTPEVREAERAGSGADSPNLTTAAPDASTGPAASGRPATPGLPRRAVVVSGGALAALVLVLAAFTLWGRGTRGDLLEPSIAVLPFANLSGDPGKDYLARGIAMEIIEKLSQLDGIEVISRNSSFTFGADEDARKVGHELNVAHVLTGTVREENGRISVTAELANGETGRAIWVQPYQGAIAPDAPDTLQRQIAEKVSGAMSIAFDVDKQSRPSGSGTRSLEAYDFYLRGLDQWWYGVDRELAAELFARAIELDPAYADAWAGRAIATASTWGALLPNEARARLKDAYEMAKKAVELDPELSVAQSIFGAISTSQREWSDAEEATRRALEISRTDMALNNREMLLLRTGRISAAYAIMLELRQVDPLRGPDDIGLASILAAMGRHAEMQEIMARDDWTESTSLRRRIFVLMAQINAEAPRASIRQSLEAISKRTEKWPAEFAKAILAVFDDPEKARAVLRSWYEDDGFEHFSKWDLIPVLAAMYDDTDLVLRVWREELPIVTTRTAYIWGPAFSEARARPEFKALMKDIGLVDYWRAYVWADKCHAVGKDDFVCS